MTLAHNPRIVTDGLVFAYDMGNAKKSWKGAPTTNYLNGSTSGTYPNAFQVVSYAGDGARSEVGTSKFGTNIIQWTATGSTYIYTRDQILDDDLATLSGQTVTFSLYIRRLEGSATGRIRVYDNISGYSYQSVSVTSDFQRVEMTKTLGANPTRIFVMLDNTGGGTYQFHSPQLEISSFATPFTYSSRSNTQALLDWTGNNTITANSLTYNSDNTFSFDGVNNYISTSYVGNTSAFTHEVFLKPTNITKDQMYIGYDNIGAHYVRIVNSRPYLSVNAAGQNTFSHSQTLVNNNVYHIVSIYNGIKLKIYVNTILEEDTAINQPLSGWGVSKIGRWRDVDPRSFVGDIFILRSYDRELSAEEVQQNYSALRGRYGI